MKTTAPVSNPSRLWPRRLAANAAASIAALLFVAGLSSASAQTNLLLNPGFEEGMTYWSPSVLRFGTGSVVTDPLVAHSGNNYVSCNGAGGSPAWASVCQGDSRGWPGPPAGTASTGANMPVDANRFYQLFAWVKVPDASPANPQPVTLRYRWETSGTRADTGSQTLTDSDWHLLTSAWAKPPAGSTWMSYWEVHSSNAIIMYVDDCALYEATSFDLTGRVVDGGGNGVDGIMVSATTTDYTSPAATTTGGGYYSLIIQPGPYTYTVNTNAMGFTGSVSVAVSGTPTVAPDITLAVDPFVRYTFDTTLQGWVSLGAGTNSFISRTGGDMTVGQTPPNYVGIDNWEARDNSTSTLWLRSPSFVPNTTTGDLTFYMAGGSGAGVGALPANDSLVPPSAGASGFMGLALRDDVTGVYVLKASRSAAGGDWQQFSFTAGAMDAVIIPGRAYTLDFIDTYVNGWGWITLDTVSIPGALVPVTYTSVSGTVTDSGLGVAGAVVTASYPGGSVSSPGSASDGSYTITNVPVGKMLTLTVSAGSYLPTYIPAPFAAPDTNPVLGKDITVAGTYHITGRVTTGGTPVAGLTVTAVGTTTYTGVTLGDGTYSIVVVNGTYTVSVPVGVFTAPPQSGVTVAGSDVAVAEFALTSGVPLVDVNLASQTAGNVTAIPNAGTLGGSFDVVGSGTAPSITAVGPGVALKKAIQFNRTGTSLLLTGATATPDSVLGITTGRPVYTILATVYRTELGDGEQACFATFAPFGRGANFFYGNCPAAWHYEA